MNKLIHDSEAPAHGKQVITACALIHHNFDGVEKIFLPKRADTKKFLPSVYEIPGGHIDFGEDSVPGLKREILEEFSMEISVGDPFASFTYKNEIKGSHSIEVVYFAKFVTSLENILLHHEDHSEFKWFAASELEKVITENKRGDDPEIVILRKAFDLLNGETLDFG